MTHVSDDEFYAINALTPMSLFPSLYAHLAYMDLDDEPTPDDLVRLYYAQKHQSLFA